MNGWQQPVSAGGRICIIRSQMKWIDWRELKYNWGYVKNAIKAKLRQIFRIGEK